MNTVRDRLWMFSVEAGTDDRHYNLPLSRMTPIESCMYMNVPNLIMVVNEKLEPHPPLEPYLRAMRPLSQVAWSIVGSGGITGWAQGHEIEMLRGLARSFPHLTGMYMDDFFNEASATGPGVLTLDRLREIRRELVLPERRLDLWVVLYTHQLDMSIREQLELIDVVNLWTWHARDLVNLEKNLARLEEITPRSRRSLGLYLWDYGEKRPIPLELMQHQCAVGLDMLRAGRVESLVFLGSYLCDLGLEAVEWTRAWIREVGALTVPLTGQ